MSTRNLMLGLSLALTATSAAFAAPHVSAIRLTPPEIAAMAKGGAGAGTSGVAGIRTTILYGDPAVAGPYTIALRVPANTRIAAHTHRDERSAVVISGTWYFGYGAKAGDAAVEPLVSGSFYTEPAGAPHFALTRKEPAMVYISGFGPTDTQYVEAAADPRPSPPDRPIAN